MTSGHTQKEFAPLCCFAADEYTIAMARMKSCFHSFLGMRSCAFLEFASMCAHLSETICLQGSQEENSSQALLELSLW